MSLFSEKLSYYIKKTRLTLLFLSSVSDLDVVIYLKSKKENVFRGIKISWSL